LLIPGRLQVYTLHYQHNPAGPGIAEWIGANPVGRGPGWEPYPLSRRIVNWVKSGQPLDGAAIASLALQADSLAGTVEYHLLANHLLANAKALVFAGVFLEGPDADRWRRRGLEILGGEIPEQVLGDGGHIERTPMYHCLVLEDLLDLINLGNAYPGLLPDWREPAGRMLSWLGRMTHPDGEISFFNDSAFGVAPTPGQICAYAEALGVAPNRRALSDSGYIRLENQDSVVLFDAAPVGPDYQPGHAHADTLSFELSHRGRRVIVNSGTSTYENNGERMRQRGTCAHSTLVLDGRNQSEVWAAFRVGRRARPLDVSASQTWAEAAHDGYKPVIHRRRLELHCGCLAVTDSLEGAGVNRAEIRFHLYPGVDPSVVVMGPGLTRSVEESTFHPQFESSVANQVVVGRWAGALPARFETEIRLA
jgi:uncharacterized heparinase superfamily protein